MTDDTDNLVLSILEDIQARLSRMEERLNNLELQITAQEQYLATLVVSLLPAMTASMR